MGGIHLTAVVLCGQCTAEATIDDVSSKLDASRRAAGRGWNVDGEILCPSCKAAALSLSAMTMGDKGKPPPMGCTGCGESFLTESEAENHREACRGTAYIL